MDKLPLWQIILVIIGGLGGIGGIVTAFISIYTASAQRHKLDVEATSQEQTTEQGAMSVLAGSTKTNAEASDILIRNLTQGLERLQKQVDKLQDDIIEREKYWQSKLNEIVIAIRKSISDRNKLTATIGCPHGCTSVDLELEETLTRILRNGEDKK